MLRSGLIRLFTSIHVLAYTWTGGRVGGSIRGTQLLLLMTTGRKSGKRRTVPVGYFMDGGNYVIAAISTSFRSGKKPGWFYNLKSTPGFTIQVKGERLAVLAQQANEEERNRLWARLIELEPSSGKYQDRVDEPIPMIMMRVVEDANREQ